MTLLACSGEVVSKAGLTQLQLVESEKYAHATFFLSSARDEPFAAELRIMTSSPKVRIYDLQLEVSAPEAPGNFAKAITGRELNVIICNYSNYDMAGHTGVMDAAMQAIGSLSTVSRVLLEASGLSQSAEMISQSLLVSA